MSYGKRDMSPALREKLQKDQRHRIIGIYEQPFLNEDGRCSTCHAPFSSPLSCRYCALVKQGREEP